MMSPSFLQRYLHSFQSIQGWFHFDAALLFMAYSQISRKSGVKGDVLEIGAYHGLSTIAMATLREDGERLVVVDPFDNSSEKNVSMYGTGMRAEFEKNFSAFWPDAEFLQVIAKPSEQLSPSDLRSGFAFCHIDGGHSHEETYQDLEKCAAIVSDGGLVAIDDYFNPEHPGVCEGAVDFSLRNPGQLRPLAIGYSKVLFQKGGSSDDTNAGFLSLFPGIRHRKVTMWGNAALVLGDPLRDHVDLYASTPKHFVPFGCSGLRIHFQPSTLHHVAQPGTTSALNVCLENVSQESTPSGIDVFGLSYHLLNDSGMLLKHDNARTWIKEPIPPGARRECVLNITAPTSLGTYIVEIDLVWESVMWFKDTGNPTCEIALEVA